MVVVGGNLRANHRQLPHILGADGAGIAAHVGQRTLAGGAGIRIVLTHMVNLIGGGIGAVMTRMTGLTTRLPPALSVRRAWGCGGWVGRRGFGRVLRMLAEAGFEVRHSLLQRRVGLLELGQLLLLERDDREERSEELPHRQWGGGPALGKNPSWWRLQIHRRSMRGVGAAVKSAGSDRVRGGLVNGYVFVVIVMQIGQELL
jgi:hypothetical protein